MFHQVFDEEKLMKRDSKNVLKER